MTNPNTLNVDNYKATVRERFNACPHETCQGARAREPYVRHSIHCDCLYADLHGGKSAPGTITVPSHLHGAAIVTGFLGRVLMWFGLGTPVVRSQR